MDFAGFSWLAIVRITNGYVRRCVGIARAALMPSSPITERDVEGLKHFAKIRSLLGSLHSNGCDRDKANNRSLHMDEYCLGVLLYLFNPAITSLRGIQQASELRNVRKKLGLKRASLGSLSESVSVFDPEPLKQIAVDLSAQVPGQVGGDFSRLTQIIHLRAGSPKLATGDIGWYELPPGCSPKFTSLSSIESVLNSTW